MSIDSNTATLAGTWRVVSAIRDGVTLSAEQIDDVRLSLDRQGKVLVTKAGSANFEGMAYVDPASTPKAWNSTQTSAGEGQHGTTLGIYEIEGDRLTLCTSAQGQARPKAFSSTPGSGHFLRVFRKSPS